QHALDAEPGPLNQLKTASAGIAAAFGAPPSENAVAALRKVGLDLETHRSQPLTEDLVRQSFAIFGMTRTHLEVLRHAYNDLPERIHLFREFLEDDPNPEIPDPYGQTIDAYSVCLDAMIEAVPSILSYLRKEYGGGS
ncbi:MAG: low molecular weight protein arginine phosphatase, partial [Opitutales bacterium]